MPLKLALIAVVYANAADDPGLNISLLQRANAWLQRRTAGAKDDLLLIGVGFVDEVAFRAMLKNYGLTSAEIALLPTDDSDVSDPTVLDESVGDIALRWIAEQQGDAIPLVDWRKLIPDTAYPSDFRHTAIASSANAV